MELAGGTRIYTLACARCTRGWQSPIPQGVCARCGRLADLKDSYATYQLPREDITTDGDTQSRTGQDHPSPDDHPQPDPGEADPGPAPDPHPES